MGIWEMFETMAAAFLILLVVVATIVTIAVAAAVIAGIIMAVKDGRQKDEMDELPDRMMEQAAAGLRERIRGNEQDRKDISPEHDSRRI